MLETNFPDLVAVKTSLAAIVYDRQGYGDSDPFTIKTRDLNYLETEAEILIKILDKLSIKEAILFGHSDGGSIAIIAASKYPERIKGIITEGAHVFVEEITLEGIQRAIHLYNTTNLKEKLIKYHGDKVDDVFNAWTQTWISPGYRHWNIEHLLQEIICDTLIIQGEHDEYGSIKQVEAIWNQVSGPSKKIIIEEASHSPHKESIEVTLKFVTEFISGLTRYKT